MFHKEEEFLNKTTDSEMDEMDTSDTQWGWFYLAECGKWHMYQVPRPPHRPPRPPRGLRLPSRHLVDVNDEHRQCLKEIKP